MKPRETLDEAIDRVATRMTQSGDAERVEIQPVWLTTSPRLWLGWRVAGVFGAAVVLLALVLMRTPRIEERAVDSPLGASALVAWSPLRGAISDVRFSGAEIDSVRTAETPRGARARNGERPAWGIPFIDPPAALAVAASTISPIDIDTVTVEALEVVPLSVGAIDPSAAKDSKEQ